jgi:hypothetical protein
MADRLFRYERLVSRHELVDLIANPAAVNKIALKGTADLKRLRRRVTEELAKKPSNPAQLDVNLVEDVHKKFQHLPRQLLLDMRFWQWLTIEVFTDFVWARWFGGKPEDVADAVSKPSAARRFLGSGSLSGTSHNTMCRIYCAAERLYSKADGYKWAKSVFQQQDRALN